LRPACRFQLALVAALASLAPGAGRADDTVSQGSLVVGQAPPGARVALDGKELRVAGDGHYVFAVARLAGPTLTLTVTAPDGKVTRRPLKVAKRSYEIDRIDGLPEESVSPGPEILARIKADAQRVAAARIADSEEKGWLEKFIWPVTGRISGVYGSQRVLNGHPMAPHLGVDIAAPIGTPIVAPADGVVTLVDPDQYLTGATVLIDHGHGVNSVYAHLSAVAVKTGQRVAQGQPIGALGMSGRATGPNLHWGVDWFATAVDPALLVPPMGGH
jgi:murein DD-endopeptidase MepM/ murein hydrolase activator NlpD